MTQIGQRIREARIQRRWSQAHLAKAARVSQPTVANWENGSHSPREAALDRLTSALEVERIWLLEGHMNGNGNATSDTMASDMGYFATPILHIPVFVWPEHYTAEKLVTDCAPIRHLAASVRAKAPFALDCEDPAVSRAFPIPTTIIFDQDIGVMHDGAFYLFLWEGKILVRRWRDEPERFEPAGDPGRFETFFPSETPPILGRAVMCVRCLID